MIAKSLRETKVWELFLDSLDELRANAVLEIEILVVISLLHTRITTDRGDVDHAVSELDECTSLDRDVEICDVVEYEPDELLVIGLSNPLDEAVTGQRLAHAIRDKTVLREAIVEKCRRRYRCGAELLLLFRKI